VIAGERAIDRDRIARENRQSTARRDTSGGAFARCADGSASITSAPALSASCRVAGEPAVREDQSIAADDACENRATRSITANHSILAKPAVHAWGPQVNTIRDCHP
jgi:hypothetical protein